MFVFLSTCTPYRYSFFVSLTHMYISSLYAVSLWSSFCIALFLNYSVFFVETIGLSSSITTIASSGKFIQYLQIHAHQKVHSVPVDLHASWFPDECHRSFKKEKRQICKMVLEVIKRQRTFVKRIVMGTINLQHCTLFQCLLRHRSLWTALIHHLSVWTSPQMGEDDFHDGSNDKPCDF